ncbi:MAG: hypothetical protein DYG92_14115 [Leptolyngbya sp. PLA1]|nr:hypothetical protein [Leptolyngbya sp. PLA1]
MTAAEASSKKFASLLKRLRKANPAPQEAPAAEGEDPIVTQLVYSMLLWEASSGQARAAFRRVRESLVDFNELRVCVPEEIASIIGERYPLSAERALRMRSVLHAVFVARHQLSLAHLASAPKREARASLEALEGIPHFVAARVVLVSLGGHAVPVDERLRDLLAAEKVIAPDLPPAAAGHALERLVRAEDSLDTHTTLAAWSDEEGHPPRRERPAISEPPEAPRAEPPRTDPPRAKNAKAKT